MSISLQIKRGTKNKILAASLNDGELALATDTQELLFGLNGVVKSITEYLDIEIQSKIAAKSFTTLTDLNSWIADPLNLAKLLEGARLTVTDKSTPDYIAVWDPTGQVMTVEPLAFLLSSKVQHNGTTVELALNSIDIAQKSIVIEDEFDTLADLADWFAIPTNYDRVRNGTIFLIKDPNTPNQKAKWDGNKFIFVDIEPLDSNKVIYEGNQSIYGKVYDLDLFVNDINNHKLSPYYVPQTIISLKDTATHQEIQAIMGKFYDLNFAITNSHLFMIRELATPIQVTKRISNVTVIDILMSLGTSVIYKVIEWDGTTYKVVQDTTDFYPNQADIDSKFNDVNVNMATMEDNLNLTIGEVAANTYDASKAYADSLVKEYETVSLYLSANNVMSTPKPTGAGTVVEKVLTMSEQLIYSSSYTIPNAGIVLKDNLYVLDLFFNSISTSRITYIRTVYTVDTTVIFDITTALNNTIGDFNLYRQVLNKLTADTSYAANSIAKLEIFGRVDNGTDRVELYLDNVDKPSGLYRNAPIVNPKTDSTVALPSSFGNLIMPGIDQYTIETSVGGLDKFREIVQKAVAGSKFILITSSSTDERDVMYSSASRGLDMNTTLAFECTFTNHETITRINVAFDDSQPVGNKWRNDTTFDYIIKKDLFNKVTPAITDYYLMDSSEDFDSVLSRYKHVELISGSTYHATNITIPNGTYIKGNGAIITLGSENDTCFLFTLNNNDITIDNCHFLGSTKNPTNTAPVGTHVAIKSTRSYRNTIKNCTFENFSGPAIIVTGNNTDFGGVFAHATVITNNRFRNNFMACIMGDRSEYSMFTNNLIYGGAYGVMANSGNWKVDNNLMVACTAPYSSVSQPITIDNTDITTLTSDNWGHGSFCNNTLNHCNSGNTWTTNRTIKIGTLGNLGLTGVYINGLLGPTFSGNTMYYCDITINSTLPEYALTGNIHSNGVITNASTTNKLYIVGTSFYNSSTTIGPNIQYIKYADYLNKVGDVSTLTTVNKTDAVSAINEINANVSALDHDVTLESSIEYLGYNSAMYGGDIVKQGWKKTGTSTGITDPNAPGFADFITYTDPDDNTTSLLVRDFSNGLNPQMYKDVTADKFKTIYDFGGEFEITSKYFGTPTTTGTPVYNGLILFGVDSAVNPGWNGGGNAGFMIEQGYSEYNATNKTVALSIKINGSNTYKVSIPSDKYASIKVTLFPGNVPAKVYVNGAYITDVLYNRFTAGFSNRICWASGSTAGTTPGILFRLFRLILNSDSGVMSTLGYDINFSVNIVNTTYARDYVLNLIDYDYPVGTKIGIKLNIPAGNKLSVILPESTVINNENKTYEIVSSGKYIETNLLQIEGLRGHTWITSDENNLTVSSIKADVINRLSSSSYPMDLRNTPFICPSAGMCNIAVAFTPTNKIVSILVNGIERFVRNLEINGNVLGNIEVNKGDVVTIAGSTTANIYSQQFYPAI